MRIALPRGTGFVAAFSAALALSGCGLDFGQNKGGGGGAGPLAIVTPSLPAAGQGVPYTTTLEASGGKGPYAWTLASGASMPPGLVLGSDGTISGTASTLGTYGFGVVVTDASSEPATDTASYSLDVSPFSASVALLHWGDGWTDESYALSSVGGLDTTFTIVTNGSGGSVTGADLAAGTATYVAGPHPGTDRIRATSASGPTQDLVVPVFPNPVKNMTARFSTTDVWHCRFSGKQDSAHSFASDFDAALATVGMRGAASFDETGSTADQLASAYVRQQTLRYLSAMYLNDEDGGAAPGGLGISFPFDEPVAPHAQVPDGAVRAPAHDQFNVISFVSGTQSGVIGTGYLDDVHNARQENNTTTHSAGELGVFVNEIAYYFNSTYANATLPSAPVGGSDIGALKALLYGTSSPGGRYTELKRIGEGFGRTMAAVTAHEIGHSLGLDHTSPPTSSSIMNASATFGPSATYAFVASDIAILQGDLPGAGRGGSPATIAAAEVAPDLAPDPSEVGLDRSPCRLRVGSPSPAPRSVPATR